MFSIYHSVNRYNLVLYKTISRQFTKISSYRIFQYCQEISSLTLIATNTTGADISHRDLSIKIWIERY